MNSEITISVCGRPSTGEAVGNVRVINGAVLGGMQRYGDNIPGAVRLWDTKTGHLIRTISFRGPVHSVVISPDDRLLAVGGEVAGLWEMATGIQKQTLSGWDIAFSPDGGIVAGVTFEKGEGAFWDVKSGERIQTAGFRDSVSAIAFSPVEPIVAVGQSDRGSDVVIWDFRENRIRQEIRTYKGRVGSVGVVMFSSDGSMLMFYGDSTEGPSVQIWTRTGTSGR